MIFFIIDFLLVIVSLILSLAVYSKINYLYDLKILYIFLFIKSLYITSNSHINISLKFARAKDYLRIINSLIVGELIFASLIYLYKINIDINIIFLDLIFTIFFLLSFRTGFKFKLKFKKSKKDKKQVLIIGAGEAGIMVLDEIRKHPDINYEIIGFIDDDKNKLGHQIKEVSVIGSIDNLNNILKDIQIDIILIAIPSAKGEVIRRIINKCNTFNIEFLVVPGIYKIISGDVKFSQIRQIQPEDLLGRETVIADSSRIRSNLKGKTILITGAAGSIGSELTKQISKLEAARIIALDNNETGLFWLEQDLKGKNIDFYIADIRDNERLEEIFSKSKIDIVFHSAAYKHVPAMEKNQSEAVKTNIIGTYNLLKICEKYNVDNFVLISTDKAINPINIMGKSKRIAELLVKYYPKTKKYCSVRFGNVLASRGSVVPLFLKDIKEKRKIQVTDKRALRYFMTIPEAVSLVLLAGIATQGKEIFILDMGQPINIYELAKQIIILSGLEPEKDVEIEITGLRPGEKLIEEIVPENIKVKKTSFEHILKLKEEEDTDKKIYTNIIDEIQNNEIDINRIIDIMEKM